MIKKPWERRLKDLSLLLKNCSATYFEPELFRMNLNQFIQTSRTVTFIIQKNKSEISGYEEWYKNNVISKWKDDEFMNWAKNSRNKIEKQGDLDMLSDAKATLIFSYIESQDIQISSKEELLAIGVKQLTKIAQKKLPPSVSDSALIKMERWWVANSLPEYELLHALTVVYSRVYECCQLLADHLGSPISKNILTPSFFDRNRNEARQVQYLKLKNMKVGRTEYETISDDISKVPQTIKEKALAFRDKLNNSVEDIVDSLSIMAEETFNEYGYHISLVLYFNKDYKTIDLQRVVFDDQSDKYIFWRLAADKAKTINAFGFVWISELWVRDGTNFKSKAIHELPIRDEKLCVIGIDAERNQKDISWSILREHEGAKPKLSSPTENSQKDGTLFFMLPILNAIGADTSDINC